MENVRFFVENEYVDLERRDLEGMGIEDMVRKYEDEEIMRVV